MYGGEDLLKSKSIAELRDLAQSLRVKAGSKKEELQLMVGSKYHEFIQSADTITTMKEDTERLETKLGGFSSSCAGLVSQMKSLLADESESNLRPEDTANNSDGGAALAKAEPFQHLDITSSAIWACLDECDIYSAAKIVILAEVLKSAYEGSDGLKKNDFVVEYFRPINSISELLSMSNEDEYMKYESASFLAETVVEDGFLILLNSNSGAAGSKADRKAQVIGSLGILSGNSSLELLRGYLHCADIVMEDIVTSLKFSGEPQGDVGTASKVLLKLVSCLQEVILDVHMMFFPSLSSPSTASGASTTMIDRYQIKLLRDLDQQLQYRLARASLIDLDNIVDTKRKTCADSTFSKTLLEIFKDWFQGAIRKVAALSDRALSSMDSAVEVSHLQNQVWKLATFSGKASTIENWNKASMKLLVSHNARDVSGSDAGSLLWSTALRPPFISHVERLLRSSCLMVFEKTKEKLLYHLLESSVSIDGDTLELKSEGVTGAFSAQEENYGETFLNSSIQDSREIGKALSSAVIFKKAEEIRSMFEAELLDMLSDVESDPSHDLSSAASSDPQSHTALTKAIYVQSSQLIGHLLILLRTLSSKLIGAIEKQRAAISSSSSSFSVPMCDKRVELQSSSGLSNTDIYENDKIDSLLSGLLLIGRLSWCLKHRGGGLWNAVDAQRQDYMKNMGRGGGYGRGSAFKRFDLSSEDQLRSAFEIADANGDGMLSVTEAMEAIQAINVSSYKSSPGHLDEAIMYEFLSPALTPSLSLQELALMCGDLLTPEATIPVARSHACLDSIIDQCHTRWSELFIKDLAQSLTSNLMVELGIDNVVYQGVNKSLWKETSLHLEDGPNEVVSVPTSYSSSLLNYLTLLGIRATHGMFSVDTTQEILSTGFFLRSQAAASAETGEHPMIDPCLANDVFKDLRKKAIPSALRAYSGVYKATLAASAGSTATSVSTKKLEAWREDCALQVIFDLNVIQKVADGDYLGTKNGQTMMKKSKETWYSLVDPINLELLLPEVDDLVDVHLSHSNLILSGLNVFGSSQPAKQQQRQQLQQQQQQQKQINVKQTQQGQEQASRQNIFISTPSPKLALLPSSISATTVGIIANTSKAASAEDGAKGTLVPSDADLGDADDLIEGESRELNLGKYLSFFKAS